MGGKKYKHWKSQLELAEEAGDDTYIQHCKKMMEEYVDEVEEEDTYEDLFSDGGSITIELYTDSVGHWEIGKGLSKMILAQDKKPKWIHRFFTKQLLGWKWVDK